MVEDLLITQLESESRHPDSGRGLIDHRITIHFVASGASNLNELGGMLYEKRVALLPQEEVDGLKRDASKWRAAEEKHFFKENDFARVLICENRALINQISALKERLSKYEG